MVLETPSTKPARFGDRSMMFAQYPAQKDTNFGDRGTTRRPASSTIGACMTTHPNVMPCSCPRCSPGR